jgi:hypothetical protein
LSLHPLVFCTLPTGERVTIHDLGTKAADLHAAEPIVRRYIAQARRARAREIRFDVFDDLAGRSVLKGRVKP